MLVSLAILCGLIGGILLSAEVGYRAGGFLRNRHPEKIPVLSSTLEASTFALMGLLIAFSFYGAGARFDARRSLVAQEANAIGTAYLRLDFLPPETQPRLRERFREYVRSRLSVYKTISEQHTAETALARSSAIQRDIWNEAVEALKASGPAEKSLVTTSLNEMIDITTVRTVAVFSHPPVAVFAVLALTVIASSALAGYTMSSSRMRDWASIMTFAIVLGSALYVSFDYEFPRFGFLRLDPFDQVLVQVLENMK